MTRFYSIEELSPRQSLLPSGTLWARDATLARTGTQRYHFTELPDVADSVVTDAAGMIDVLRDAADVFDPTSMRSFEGVPVTLGHPTESVDPSNWRDLAVGHVANVKRAGDTLTADLLIHDQRGIRAVREFGWRALSAGYDAQYLMGPDGRLQQRAIVANHLALLPPEQEGRCGDVCMVGDAAGPPRLTLDSARRILSTEASWLRRHRAGERVVDHLVAHPEPLIAWRNRALGRPRSITEMSDAELHDAGRAVRRLVSQAAARDAAASTPQAIAREADARRQERQRTHAAAVTKFWSAR